MPKIKTKASHQIVMVELDKITRYHNNPRRNSHAVAKVKESISRFGFNQPIVLDEDYVIIAGDTRFMAATELDHDPVPCIVVDLSPEQAKAYRIADNRVGEESSWDWERLVEELSELSEQNIDGVALGFDQDELDHLLGTNETELDHLFKDSDKPDDGTKENRTVTLDYSTEDYEQVSQWFDALPGSKERIVFDLLQRAAESDTGS